MLCQGMLYYSEHGTKQCFLHHFADIDSRNDFNSETEQLISIWDLQYLKQQFADLIFAFGGRLMQRGELPQVGHVDHSTMNDEELSDLVMPIGTGVVQGDQATT